MQEQYRKKGFTLIELLIVIAVIGGLATLFATSYPASQGRARDTHRRNDLKQYQTALETFANKNNGTYPVAGAIVKPSIFCGAGNPLENYTNCPDDPRDNRPDCSGSSTCRYRYVSNASGTQYSLWATLERPADDTKKYFIICSTGITYQGGVEPGPGSLCP